MTNFQPKPKHLGPEYGAQFQDRCVAEAYRKRPEYRGADPMTPDCLFHAFNLIFQCRCPRRAQGLRRVSGRRIFGNLRGN